MDIKKAIEHYNYGISHDIFREPVTSYAKLAVDSLERQYPMEHHHTKIFEVSGKARESICPRCLGSIVTNENEYPTFCVWCGQKIRWTD